MKQYVIDELRPDDYRRIKAFLDQKFGTSALDSIYWIPLEPRLYDDTQKAHKACQPYYFALDLEAGHLACELLVRTKNRVRCQCITYASAQQRNWLIDSVDAFFSKLEIKT